MTNEVADCSDFAVKINEYIIQIKPILSILNIFYSKQSKLLFLFQISTNLVISHMIIYVITTANWVLLI